jgi:hypothetical protein
MSATGCSLRFDRMADASGLPRSPDINKPARPIRFGRNADMTKQSDQVVNDPRRKSVGRRPAHLRKLAISTIDRVVRNLD